MRISQRFAFSKKEPPGFLYGIWNPGLSDWRDIVEDYIYISRKRKTNKLAILKLQLFILQDILTAVDVIDKYKEKLKEFQEKKEKNNSPSGDIDGQIRHIENEISFNAFN